MSVLIQDIKYAIRRLRRTPVFALFAIAILAIGIGLNVAVFGLVDAMLLRPAPFAEPDRLVHIYQDSDSGSPGVDRVSRISRHRRDDRCVRRRRGDDVGDRELGDARRPARGGGRFRDGELFPGARACSRSAAGGSAPSTTAWARRWSRSSRTRRGARGSARIRRWSAARSGSTTSPSRSSVSARAASMARPARSRRSSGFPFRASASADRFASRISSAAKIIGTA